MARATCRDARRRRRVPRRTSSRSRRSLARPRLGPPWCLGSWERGASAHGRPPGLSKRNATVGPDRVAAAREIEAKIGAAGHPAPRIGSVAASRSRPAIVSATCWSASPIVPSTSMAPPLARPWSASLAPSAVCSMPPLRCSTTKDRPRARARRGVHRRPRSAWLARAPPTRGRDRSSATRASTRATPSTAGWGEQTDLADHRLTQEQGRERDRDPDLVGAQEHVEIATDSHGTECHFEASRGRAESGRRSSRLACPARAIGS